MYCSVLISMKTYFRTHLLNCGKIYQQTEHWTNNKLRSFHIQWPADLHCSQLLLYPVTGWFAFFYAVLFRFIIIAFTCQFYLNMNCRVNKFILFDEIFIIQTNLYSFKYFCETMIVILMWWILYSWYHNWFERKVKENFQLHNNP